MSTYEQSEKLTLMRESERMNRKEMSQLLDIPYSSLANYEAGRMKMSFEAGSKIFKHPRFRKYRDWFMFDEINPEAGQIAPVLAHFGQDSTTSPQSGQKNG
ncbi:helix-turn-helix domain-containing protein [Serratia proteamaculans]|uniref:helix-turn-helix domain-containing protein n=1 Tax=Serratia TaxID=613 RepID=UPI00124A6E03|nr:helix-turn-helix transcriptional regulator [Serratia proteamaculans]KAB1496371.1 helix-turn-helix transcriptional regulator [Serratia proteamaculans]CAI0968351.1 Uncharacterised protein [Serratia proteamaculans]CAI0971842.1 Uncharacterised protein [Serratia proteamaculans]